MVLYADNLIVDAIVPRYEVVSALPEAGDSNTIYLTEEQGGTYAEYIYTKCGWMQIGSSGAEEPRPEKHKEYHPTNCKNCGAALKSATCEYGGTHYT